MDEVIHTFSIFLFDIHKLYVVACGWLESVEGGMSYRFIGGFDISNKGKKTNSRLHLFNKMAVCQWQLLQIIFVTIRKS